LRTKSTESNKGIHYKDLRVAAISLGCSKNRVDTEEILGYLTGKGAIITGDYTSAQIVFVNTCGFIEDAQQEAINTLVELGATLKGSGTKLVATGCLVEVFGSRIISAVPEIDGAIGVHSYKELDRFFENLLSGKRLVIKRPPPTSYEPLAPRLLTGYSHSVNVKIAEGCSNRCSYCLIPGIRGAYRSRSPEGIINEIETHVKSGAREINLIAQDTTAYGSDKKDYPNFSELVEMIMGIKERFWLRIMYTYPSRIDARLIKLIAAEKRICNYLDVPIQHADSQVLRAMGRHYDGKNLQDLISTLRTEIPGLALRTTCMVGYPGEKAENFNTLLDFIAKTHFEHLGSFVYSSQKGTPACGFDGAVPARIAKKRKTFLMEKQRGIAQQLNLKQVGSEPVLLIDRVVNKDKLWYYGRTERQAPDVDGGVYIRSEIKLKPGDWVRGKIVAAGPYSLLATKPVLLDQLPI
jgi:ribosomal protein S12 methylthiotransferase